KYRKYDDQYLDFGFTYVSKGNVELPQCVVCHKVLAAESMLPNKLKHHLETIHSNLIKSCGFPCRKPQDFFARKLRELKHQSTSLFSRASIPSKALLASYKVAHRIAKCKKLHTIAEDLILPAAIDMVSVIIGKLAAKEIKNVTLFNNMISRRIHDIAEDINEQTVEKLSGLFAIQLDEAADSNNNAQLICYVRYMEGANVCEDLLFCKEMTDTRKASDLFAIIDSYMKENKIQWENCVDVCTDGACTMSGQYGGLQALIKTKAPNAKWTHCVIHRKALATKNISPELNIVIDIIIKVVNFIKTRLVKARFFRKLCEDLGAEHTSLLYYCNSCWLSRGNVLSRIYELKHELYTYLLIESHRDAEKFKDTDFLIKLAYLCDIFEKLNVLNKSLQGNETHIMQLADKIAAFKKKLLLWKRKIEEEHEITDCFPVLNGFLQEKSIQNLEPSLQLIFIQHLSTLSIHFDTYFPKNVNQYDWIRDPFQSIPTPSTLSTVEEEQLLQLSCDTSLKLRFDKDKLFQFWSNVSQEYPAISTTALKVLLPFTTSYLCETGFSAVAVIKSKYRSQINLEKKMRVAISKLQPRFEKLCSEKQAHLLINCTIMFSNK
ncbi:zinc finger BED domain-containing protein 5-like, partial [Centruroides sculpturatus]|uniref:zinc finger BED domain-containing protein 5-like n=1 Tax=Centruroides sculpturatus TaxID=218467 RepID=UPI000C6E57BF